MCVVVTQLFTTIVAKILFGSCKADGRELSLSRESLESSTTYPGTSSSSSLMSPLEREYAPVRANCSLLYGSSVLSLSLNGTGVSTVLSKGHLSLHMRTAH
jgi:hypothetical protein